MLSNVKEVFAVIFTFVFIFILLFVVVIVLLSNSSPLGVRNQR